VISRQSQPAALLISAHPPGSGSGAAVRGSITLRTLKATCDRVDAVAFATPDERPFAAPEVQLIERPPLRASRKQNVRTLLTTGSAYWPERQARLLEEVERRIVAGDLGREYDIVWAHSSLMARAALRCFRARTRILDIDNLAALDARRAAATTDGTLPQRLLRRIDAAAIGREEQRRIASFPDVVLCSERERRLLGNVPGRVQVVPNAVPGPDRPYDVGPDPTLLFVGFLGYDVNVDALQLLIGEILPRICSRRPDARLVVAGRSPNDAVVALAEHPAVDLVADTPSLEPLYRAARVVVAPLRKGGGTRIKVLEAMARGKPMVLTPVAAEGLDLTAGRQAFIEDEPAGFAERCVQLLEDSAMANTMGLHGRRTWHELHRPERAMERIADIVTGALANGTWSGPAGGGPDQFLPASQGPAEPQT
jgi:glycosyltransferase involved in cell wall biosynthesis